MIQVIQYRKGHKLAYFAAQADAAFVAKTVYDFIDPPGGFPIFHPLGDGCFRHVVRDAVKEVAHVAAQHPAARQKWQRRVSCCFALRPVVSFQVAS